MKRNHHNRPPTPYRQRVPATERLADRTLRVEQDETLGPEGQGWSGVEDAPDARMTEDTSDTSEPEEVDEWGGVASADPVYAQDDEVDEDELDEEDPVIEEDDEEEDELEEYTPTTYRVAQLIPLPSGKGIRVRPTSLLTLLRGGRVPNHLVAAARKLVEKGPGAVSQARQERRGPQRPGQRSETDDLLELMDFLVTQLVVSFPVVNKPPSKCLPGEVSVQDLWDADKNAIVAFAFRGQRALASFR